MGVDRENTGRILLIGVNGQLGWELRRSLRPLGAVICAVRGAGTTGGGAAEPVLPVDLADPDSIRALIRSVRPGLIVNAAAYSLVDQAEREPEAAEAVNAAAPGVIQSEARTWGAAAVHYSTDYVFDGGGDRPRTETDPTGPLGVYGRTKLAGEQAVAAAGGPHWIFRTSWVYGVHGANFVKKILKLAAARPQLRVVADQIGAPTSARFLADATAQVLSQARGRFGPWAEAHGGLFHLCSAGETSWHGLTERVVAGARAAGMPLAVETIEPIASAEFPTPARRPLNSRLDCSRFRREFDLTPPHWTEALDDTLPTLLRYEFGLAP